jgi:hypothetical protein
LGSARIHPGGQRFDFFSAQPNLIAELDASVRISRPRRHLAHHHFFFDRFGPRPRRIVRQQRNSGSYFPRPMTSHAALEENRRHLLAESGRSTFWSRRSHAGEIHRKKSSHASDPDQAANSYRHGRQ